MRHSYLLLISFFCIYTAQAQSAQKIKELNISIGVIQKGRNNAITDVSGVKVGQTTIIKADSIRTGVTAILPHGENLFQQKVPAVLGADLDWAKTAIPHPAQT